MTEVVRWVGRRLPKWNYVIRHVLSMRTEVVVHSRFEESFRWYAPGLTPEEAYSTYFRVVGGRSGFRYEVTEELWNKMEWSRPIQWFYPWRQDGQKIWEKRQFDAQDGVTSKPTWAELDRWFTEWEVNSNIAGWDNWNVWEEVPKQTAAAVLAKAIPHSSSDSGVHLGRGLDHAPAMIYNSLRSNMAGEPASLSLMRDGAGDLVEIWTREDAHNLIGAQAALVNHVESGRNLIARQMRKLAEPWRDERGGLGPTATEEEIFQARLAAYEKVIAYRQIDNLDKVMAAEIKRLSDPDTLPDDVGTLRKFLTERLEETAMAKTKEVMKAATQQGIDRGFSCVDEERAARDVARQCVLGSSEIKRADDDIWKRDAGSWTKLSDTDPEPDTIQHEGAAAPASALGADGDFYLQLTAKQEAKAAFDAAVAAIEAVTVVNVPEWKVNGTAALGSVDVTDREIVVRAHNPAGVDGGKVVIPSWTAKFAPGTRTPPKIRSRAVVPGDDADAHQMVITVPADALLPLEFGFKAQNLCGPADITVRLTQ